jgi:hypothetical protein
MYGNGTESRIESRFGGLVASTISHNVLNVDLWVPLSQDNDRTN